MSSATITFTDSPEGTKVVLSFGDDGLDRKSDAHRTAFEALNKTKAGAALDEVASVVDTLDNLVQAMTMPVADSIHMQGLRAELPKLAQQLRAACVAGGVNPWGA